MDDLVGCLHVQRACVLNKGGGQGTEEDELAAMKERMMLLESHYDDFHKLSVVQELRSFLARKIFDSEKTKKAAAASLASTQVLEAARREVIHDLRMKCSLVRDDMLLHHEFRASSSSSSKKQKKSNGQFELFDFDDLPPYEPLENVLRELRIDCLHNGAIAKLLEMDALELVEHPQWEELVKHLDKGFAATNSSHCGCSTSSNAYNSSSFTIAPLCTSEVCSVNAAVKMIQIHIKFFSAFSGQQSMDIASNVIKYLWNEWNLNLANSSPPARPSVHLTPLQRSQLAAFTLIASSIPNHFILCSDKVVEKTICTLFFLLSKGYMTNVVEGNKIFTSVLDCIVNTTDSGKFISRFATAFSSLQVTALALQTGLIDELGRRLESYNESWKSDKQHELRHIDSLMFPFLIFLRMWLVLSPSINTGVKSDRQCKGDIDTWDASRQMRLTSEFELVADTNKKFTKVSGSFSLIEALLARIRGESLSIDIIPCYRVSVLDAFLLYTQLMTLKNESFERLETEKYERTSEMTELSCDIFSLFIPHLSGFDFASKVVFLEGLYQFLVSLEQSLDVSIPGSQQWSAATMSAVLTALDHYLCTTAIFKHSFKADDEKLVTVLFLCLQSVTESGLRMISICTHSTSFIGLNLTLTVIRTWIRAVSGMSLVKLQQDQTLVVIKVLQLCNKCLKDFDDYEESSDNHFHNLKIRIRSSAMELIVLVSNHLYSFLFAGIKTDLERFLKDNVLANLLSSISSNEGSQFDDWEMGKGPAILNIAGSFSLNSLIMLDRVLAEDLTDPFTLETLVTNGQVSEPLKSLFCLFDGLVFLGGIDEVLSLMIKSSYSLDRLFLESRDSLSDKPSIQILMADNIDWQSEDFGCLVYDLLDVSMLNTDSCLKAASLINDLTHNEMDFSVKTPRYTIFKVSSGPDLDSINQTNATTIITTETLSDIGLWCNVSIDSLLLCSFNFLPSTVWELDIVIFNEFAIDSILPTPRFDNHTCNADSIACMASETIYETMCLQNTIITEAFKGYEKARFQQLIVACDRWSTESNFVGNSQGFNWFIGACSFSWPLKAPSGTYALPYILQFIHNSTRWTDFFKDGLRSTISRVCELLCSCCGSCILGYLTNIGFPIAITIKAIIHQWFFKYLSIQDIQRLTVLSVLRGPDIIVCTIASIIERFVTYLNSSHNTNCSIRGMIAFKTFLASTNISLLSLAPQIQNYISIYMNHIGLT